MGDEEFAAWTAKESWLTHTPEYDLKGDWSVDEKKIEESMKALQKTSMAVSFKVKAHADAFQSMANVLTNMKLKLAEKQEIEAKVMHSANGASVIHEGPEDECTINCCVAARHKPKKPTPVYAKGGFISGSGGVSIGAGGVAFATGMAGGGGGSASGSFFTTGQKDSVVITSFGGGGGGYKFQYMDDDWSSDYIINMHTNPS